LLNGGTATGTVTLNGTAGSNIVVTLSSSALDAYPTSGSVTILQGTVSRTFTIGTSLRTVTPKTVTITATHGAITRQATVTVNPPWLTTLSLSPFSPIGGDPSTATATLNGPAPLNAGYQVTFTSSNTNLVATPHPIAYSQVTTGQTSVLTNPVTSSTPVLITGLDSTGISTSQTLTLQPATVTLASLTLSPTSVVGSNKVTGTVTLTAVAPVGGVIVDLKSSHATLAYPGMLVPVAAGSNSATFTVSTTITTTNTNVTISAIHAATTKNATLTVQVPTAANFVAFCGLSAQQVTGGSSMSGSVSLNTVATASRTVILSSSNPAVASVPSSVTVKKGAQSQPFTVTTSSIASPADVTITATCGGTSQTVKLIVLPANGVAVASVVMAQPFVDLGTYWRITGSSDVTPIFGFGFVNLTGAAPAGGATVTITGSRANTIVIYDVVPPPTPTTTLVVPAGATSAVFYGQMYPFTGIDRGTTFAATYSGVTRTVDVLVTAQPQASLERREPILCASLSLAPCLATAAFIPTTLAVGDSSGYSLYTPELHLLAETEISTAPTKSIAYSYLWFGDLPVASVEAAANTTRWFATDHLGTPLIQTSSSGAVVWRAEHAPYGDVFAFRAGAAVHQPLRLPGQIAQDRIEPHYNVFRWYRSSWGRYTQSDPIGILGGKNVFSYVVANPIHSIDRLGLVGWKCDFTVSGGGEVVGGGALRATCTSDCVNKQRRWVMLTGAIWGFTFGIPISFTGAHNVSLEDGTTTPAGANLAGRAEYHVVGINVIAGCGNTDITLGRAKGSTGLGCSWWSGLISAGIDNFWGDVEVAHQHSECCK